MLCDLYSTQSTDFKSFWHVSYCVTGNDMSECFKYVIDQSNVCRSNGAQLVYKAMY